MTTHTTQEREHYTSLAYDEGDHSHADCGCTLRRDDTGNVRLYQCPPHAAAPELLAALVEVDALLTDADDRDELPDADLITLRAVRAAIAKAMG